MTKDKQLIQLINKEIKMKQMIIIILFIKQMEKRILLLDLTVL